MKTLYKSDDESCGLITGLLEAIGKGKKVENMSRFWTSDIHHNFLVPLFL